MPQAAKSPRHLSSVPVAVTGRLCDSWRPAGRSDGRVSLGRANTGFRLPNSTYQRLQTISRPSNAGRRRRWLARTLPRDKPHLESLNGLCSCARSHRHHTGRHGGQGLGAAGPTVHQRCAALMSLSRGAAILGPCCTPYSLFEGCLRDEPCQLRPPEPRRRRDAAANVLALAAVADLPVWAHLICILFVPH